MTVRFNATDEYIDEMKKNVERMPVKILRITKRARLIPGAERMFITATHRIEDEIIRLDRYVGELRGAKMDDAPTYRKAEAIMNSLEKTAKELGLEVRAGMYDETTG